MVRISSSASSPRAPSTPSIVGRVKQLCVGMLLLGGRSATASAWPTPTAPMPVCPRQPFYTRAPVALGMEQEFNGLTPQEAVQVLQPVLGPMHATPQTWGTWLGRHDVANKGKNLGHWRAVPDISLSGSKSFELVSPALHYEQTPLLAAANAEVGRHGGSTDSMAALHIHVNRTALPTDAVVQLLQVAHTQADMMYRLSRTSPRQAQYYARPLEPDLITSLRLQPPQTHADIYEAAWATSRSQLPAFTPPSDAMRYYMVNLKYLLHGQTIEFRQFDATMDPVQVQAFVDFTLALTTAARDGDLQALADEPLDPDNPDDAALFLDTIGLVGPQLQASRAALLANAAQPRPFEWADGEIVRLGVDMGLTLGGLLARRTPGMAPLGCAALMRTVAVLAERYGLSNFEVTHAVRAFTWGQLLAAQALFTGIALWPRRWRRGA